MSNKTTNHVQPDSFVMVPLNKLEQIIETQTEILNHLKNPTSNSQDSINPDYISEEETRKLLKRGSTWLWQMRKDGKLNSYKIGRTIYYLKSDISSLIKKGGDDE